MRIVRSNAHVRVPATSGNLGPGFDCMGMAHDLWDDVSVRLTTGETRVFVEGEGADYLPTNDSHLIVKVIRRTLEIAGLPQSGIELKCHNRIPQGRGLGSSAAAVVAGLMLVRALTDSPDELNDNVLLEIATEFEGHPDNAAPAILGGAVVAWMEGEKPHAASLDLSPDLHTTLLIPESELLTETARSVLPQTVPHKDAAFNASRAALLVLALSKRPDLLMSATQDRLHQDYRADAMQATAQAIRTLRDAGWPAVVSGAGPSILVLDALDHVTAGLLAERGFRSIIGPRAPGAQIIPE